MVYEEDSFSFSDTNGAKSVSYTCNLPHKSNHIIACFIRITRTDGSIDYSVMYEEDWGRLAGYSAKQNKRWDNERRQYIMSPNELYTSNNGGIDAGFLMAKCIKHAFKTYPKVRIGKGTELQTEQEEPADNDFYGVSENSGIQPEPASEPFGPRPDISAGVTVHTEGTAEDDGAF